MIRKSIRLAGKTFAMARRLGWAETARRGRDRILWQAGILPLRHADIRFGQIVQRLDGVETRPGLSNEPVRVQVSHNMDSIRWLAETGAVNRQRQPVSQEDGPAVSVVMAVRNRAGLVVRAIQSVLDQTYGNWELIVVDDGSTDGTGDAVGAFAGDPRVRLIRFDARGAGAARNEALREATGDVVAYLDSDNVWFDTYLEHLAAAYLDPETETAYAAQLVQNRRTGASRVRCIEFDRERFCRDAGIDLNAFSHRRGCYETRGGFDTGLTRLMDWDLMCRYTAERDPVFVPVVCGKYFEDEPGSITAENLFHYNRHLLQKKHETAISRPLRVLYVVHDYPQLTETYIRWEIVRMQKWGVHVEVWSEEDKTQSPFEPEAPVHTGPLEAAIDKARPDLFHVHWIHFVERYRDVMVRTGLPITVRGHGYEFSYEGLCSLLEDGAIQKTYMFPHYAQAAAGSPVVTALPSAFNPDLYYPAADKDRRMVLRTSSVKDAKNLKFFIDTAQACPDHRFVLVLGRLKNQDACYEDLIAYNELQKHPVEIHVNLPTERAAELVREAGVYLHTYGDSEPFGMPISIAEAMATGCITLVRALPGAAEYVGEAGILYGSLEEAAFNIVWRTSSWYDEQWTAAQRACIEHAYGHHLDTDVVRTIVDDWLDLTDHVTAPILLETSKLPDVKPVIDFVLDDPVLARFHVYHRSYVTHGLGTYHMLRTWQADDDICLAGLIHSIYRHDRTVVNAANRARVRQLIGERGERMVYVFSATFWASFEEAVRRGPPYGCRDLIAHGDIALDDGDMRQLMLIHLAEWLEKAGRAPAYVREAANYDEIAQWLGGEQLQTFERICGEIGRRPMKPALAQRRTDLPTSKS